MSNSRFNDNYLQIGKSNGILAVALYQDEKSVHVIIQNSCRKDLPKLHKLKTNGFSTNRRK